MNTSAKQQQCALSAVWYTWLGLPAVALAIGLTGGWVSAAFVLAVGAVAQVYYVRVFPRLSERMGYGSVADAPVTDTTPAAKALVVTLFTANVCPFCPLMKQRLRDLQTRMGFELREVDVTFRPQIMLAKHLRSVPVTEANGRTLMGNATSAELAAFLRDAA